MPALLGLANSTLEPKDEFQAEISVFIAWIACFDSDPDFSSGIVLIQA